MRITIDVRDLKRVGLTANQLLFLLKLNHNGSADYNVLFSSDERGHLLSKNFIDSDNKITEYGYKKLSALDLFHSDEEIEDVLKRMRDLFPAKVKTGNKLVKSALNKGLIQRLKEFTIEYGYSLEDIYKATQLYIKTSKDNNYEYMRTLFYFIKKQGQGSDLADYCEQIISGDYDGTTGDGVQRITRTL